MTRTMYDAIDALRLPTGGDLYAGYIDGHWPSANAIAQRFPHALVVRIATNPNTDDGIVLDTEPGDATPEQAVNWVLKRRAAHVDPTVYCSLSEWPQVKAAFATHDVPEPHWWIAHYSSDHAIPAGAVALQHTNTPGYDESAVADYWPGVDPAPATTESEDDEMPYFPIEVGPDKNGKPNATGQVSWPAGIPHVLQLVGDPSLYDAKSWSFRLAFHHADRGPVVVSATLAAPSNTVVVQLAQTAVHLPTVRGVTVTRPDGATGPWAGHAS